MATSTITNTVLDPNGNAVSSAVVEVKLMPTAGFRIDTFTEVARLTRTTTNGSGVWSLALERNSNITPTDTWYQVTEYIPNVYGGKRVWTIQVGAVSTTLLASLIDPLAIPPSGPLGGPLNYLTQTTADARYQAFGTFGGVPLTTSLDGTATGSAGVATSASRSDHDHVAQNDAWTSYTPTLTQSATVTKTVTYAKYQRTGRMITGSVTMTVTGSGTAANAVNITLPVTSVSPTGNVPIGIGWIFDVSTSDTLIGMAYLFSTTSLQLVSTRATGNVLGTGGGFSAGLASPDQVTVTFTYEAAT